MIPRRAKAIRSSAIAVLLCLGWLGDGASVQAAAEPLQRFVFEKAEMGLPFRITLYAPDEAQAKASAEAAFARISALNAILSDYDSDSELSRLSRTSGTGATVPVSRDLWSVLAPAQALAERTDGAFDVTVGPFVHLWRRARRKQELPSAQMIAEARARVGYRHFRLNESARTAELLAPEMRLDLGAIAKGFAVDEALAVLRDRGLPHALIGGGGDMAAGEAPPGEEGWRVEVAALDLAGAPPAQVVLLKNSAIATSGDVFQRVEIGGKRYSHIVDPRTGQGLTDHGLVSVVAEKCITADSLATAISVLGQLAGLELADTTPGVAAHIVRKPGDQLETASSGRWEAVPKLPLP
ncbi:MAG TPA: FAD:protein FMN transferase [Chthoniobacteraceae bacterium]